MSAVVEVEENPARLVAEPGVRTIRVGIVGLGQVGQAVARLAPDATRLRDAGVRFRVVGALVRDLEKPRRCNRPPRVTTNASAFLRGSYDVVVEALGSVEPARSIVSRLLGRGVPVVTANKALVAAHGAELTALAHRRGTTFRYEASALAGVPFLGALAARPLVSDVVRFTAVVNGTSNFILSALDGAARAFDDALAEARVRGLTEPDASRDLDGLDAADKLALLSTIFGWGGLPSSPPASAEPPSTPLDVQGIRGITPRDLAVARALGGTIKPVVHAELTPAGISAFIGPALVAARHPLASLDGTLSGIQFSGRYVSDLFFSGPGAGPDVTAATIADDAVEAVSSVSRAGRPPTRGGRLVHLAPPPVTGWLVRARFPGYVPDATAAERLFAAHGLAVTRATDVDDDTRWLQLGAASRADVDRGLAEIATTHRVHTFAIRSL